MLGYIKKILTLEKKGLFLKDRNLSNLSETSSSPMIYPEAWVLMTIGGVGSDQLLTNLKNYEKYQTDLDRY